MVTDDSLHEALRLSLEWVDHSCPSSKQADQGLGSSLLEREVKKPCALLYNKMRVGKWL